MGIIVGPAVSVASVATGFRRVGVVVGAVLCWIAVVFTMPLFVVGLALLPAATVLTVVAAAPAEQRGKHLR